MNVIIYIAINRLSGISADWNAQIYLMEYLLSNLIDEHLIMDVQ